MNKSLIVAAALLVFALVAGALWWASGGEPAPLAGAGAADPAGAPAPARAETAPAAIDAHGAAAAAPQRTEAPAAAGAGGFALLGRVVDDRGQPVADADVQCLQLPGFGRRGGFDFAGFEAGDFDPAALIEQMRNRPIERAAVATDASGEFRLLPPAGDGQLLLRIAARGQQLLERPAARPAGADVDLGVLALRRGAVVAGRVVDGKGAPIAEARVVARRGGGGRGGPAAAFADLGFDLAFDFGGGEALDPLRGDGAVTGADGRFELLHVAPGTLALRARHRDHPPAGKDGLELAAGQQLLDVVVVLPPGATIRGRVVDAPAGLRGLRVSASQRRDEAPAAGEAAAPFAQLLVDAREELADVLPLGERSAEVAADGSFEFRGLEPGASYRLVAAQTGRGLSGLAACSEPQEVAAGSTGVELRYQVGISVRCRVVAAADGSPVERLWIEHRLQGGGGLQGLVLDLAGAGGRARASEHPDGVVVLAGLRPKPGQTLRLQIRALGCADFEKTGIELPTAGELDLGTITLAAAPLLAVRVLGDGQAPVARADVQLRPAPRGDAARGPFGGGRPFERGGFGGGRGPSSGRTDDDGRCLLNGDAGAAASLQVTARGFAPWQLELPPLPAGGRDQEVQLVHGGSVEVSVLGADGQPLPRAQVEHEPPFGRSGPETTGDDGKARFAQLAPGTHRFRLGQRGGRGMEVLLAGGRGGRGDGGWQTVEVQDGAVQQLVLQKSATAALRGVVRQDGAPLAGASVTLLQGAGGGGAEAALLEAFGDFGGRGRRGGNGRSDRTGDDGAYALRELPPGQHRLRVTHRSRAMPTTIDVVLREGDNVVDVDLAATVLRGTVRDPQGQPVAGATIAVAAAGGAPQLDLGNIGGLDLGAMSGQRTTVKSGADGGFELRGVAGGTRVTIAATAKGLARGTVTIDVPAAGSVDGIDLQLGAAGSIHVTTGGGDRLGGVRATCVDAAGQPVEGMPPVMSMLRRGSGTLDGLQPGRWKVEKMGLGGPDGEPQFVEVEAGKVAELRF